MKKIKYLLSAIPAALFATSAHADISVSGSGTAAYTDAGGNAPVAQNDTGVVNEDATLTVSNGANKNESGGTYDTNGEHSGDVIDTSNSSTQDTDADGDTLTVTAVRIGSTEGSGSSGSVGSALTGTYGQLP